MLELFMDLSRMGLQDFVFKSLVKIDNDQTQTNIPGRMPARNSFPTEVWVATP